MLWLSMFNGTITVRINPKDNKFVTGVKIKAAVDPKRNYSPGIIILSSKVFIGEIIVIIKRGGGGGESGWQQQRFVRRNKLLL